MKNKQKVVVVSGYFSPVHKGHIEYFQLAKKLAGKNGKVICILNNDTQLFKKSGRIFMEQEERKKILQEFRSIDEVYISIDDDETVCNSLQALNPDIFAKGGDRFINEIPESKICRDLGIEMVDSLGKKIQSSSTLIKNYRGKK